jgi:glycosyltransferase involved in cell wall biosynthesis
VVAVSNFERSLLIDHFGVEEDRLRVVPPIVTIDGKASKASIAGRIKLVTVGRLDEGKGHIGLLEALRRSPRRDHFSLSILGADSTQTQTILELAAGLEGSVAVTVDASRDEILDAVSSADVFVSASHYEAFGIAAVEAACLGLAVAGFNVGALPGLIGQGDGCFVEFGDYDALLDTSLNLANAERLTSLRTERSERYRRRYGRDSWVESWKAVYRDVALG